MDRSVPATGTPPRFFDWRSSWAALQRAGGNRVDRRRVISTRAGQDLPLRRRNYQPFTLCRQGNGRVPGVPKRKDANSDAPRRRRNAPVEGAPSKAAPGDNLQRVTAPLAGAEVSLET